MLPAKRWFKRPDPPLRGTSELKDLQVCQRPNDGSKAAKRWFKSHLHLLADEHARIQQESRPTGGFLDDHSCLLSLAENPAPADKGEAT